MASARSEPGPPNSAPASGQLDFYEAMADFRTMFPKLDPDVIEAVLRANNGVVESTIDHLLKLNEGNEETTPAPDASSGDLLPPSYDAATAAERQAQKAAEAGVRERPSDPPRPQRQHQAAPTRSPQASGAAASSPGGGGAGGGAGEDGATGGYRNWKPPLLGALPEDFLRLTTAAGRGNRGAGGRCRNCGRHHHHHRHHHRHASARRPNQQPVPAATAAAVAAAAATASGHPSAGPVGIVPKAATLPSAGVSDMDTVEGLLHRRLMENEMKRRSSAGNGPGLDADVQQCLDDERMAIMLQNEEFLHMLRRDAEFMRALHSDRTGGLAHGPPGNGEVEERSRPELATASSLERSHPLSDPKDDNEELRRQLKHMGKSSKKKFADLAKRFFTVRYKKKQPTIPPDPGESRSPQPQRFYKTDLPTESTMNLLDDDEADEESRHLRQREESERPRREPIAFEPLPGALSALPSYRTVQRPMYHPDCVSTFHDDHKDMV